jgi:hypothetical protein
MPSSCDAPGAQAPSSLPWSGRSRCRRRKSSRSRRPRKSRQRRLPNPSSSGGLVGRARHPSLPCRRTSRHVAGARLRLRSRPSPRKPGLPCRKPREPKLRRPSPGRHGQRAAPLRAPGDGHRAPGRAAAPEPARRPHLPSRRPPGGPAPARAPAPDLPGRRGPAAPVRPAPTAARAEDRAGPLDPVAVRPPAPDPRFPGRRAGEDRAEEAEAVLAHKSDAKGAKLFQLAKHSFAEKHYPGKVQGGRLEKQIYHEVFTDAWKVFEDVEK